jgi:hypothetical protein
MAAASLFRINNAKEQTKRPVQKLNCHLKCEQCQLEGSTAVVVGDCFYISDYTKGRTMYKSYFILGFCTLVQNVLHKAEARYKNNHNIIAMFVFCTTLCTTGYLKSR